MSNARRFMECIGQAEGPGALDKHPIQGKCIDLSHFPIKSKCKFINIINSNMTEKEKHLQRSKTKDK